MNTATKLVGYSLALVAIFIAALGVGSAVGSTKPGPSITFYADVPSAGDCRLFLDFRHNGVVRTAEFTARASD